MSRLLPPTSDRVRIHTNRKNNKKIKNRTLSNITEYIGRSDCEISRRLKELDREWDIERVLETNASILILAGIILGFIYGKGWFMLSGVIAAFLLQHSIQGWCPPLPLLRKLGVRTSSEIDGEKAALRLLRGDFKDVLETPREIYNKTRMH